MLNTFRLAIAVLLLGVSFAPGVASADHDWYGCPTGWDAEVAGYTTGSTWVSYRVQVDGSHFEDQWFYFPQETWPGFSFGARIGVQANHRVDGAHIFTADSAWHIARKDCHAP